MTSPTARTSWIKISYLPTHQYPHLEDNDVVLRVSHDVDVVSFQIVKP